MALSVFSERNRACALSASSMGGRSQAIVLDIFQCRGALLRGMIEGQLQIVFAVGAYGSRSCFVLFCVFVCLASTVKNYGHVGMVN